VASDDGAAEAAAATEAQGAHQQRQKAIGDMLNAWTSKPPQTTVVLEPAVLKEGAGERPALGTGAGRATPEKVLIRRGAASTPIRFWRSTRIPAGRSSLKPTRDRSPATG